MIKLGRRAKQIVEFDAETGEIYKDFTTFGTQNGDGWMIMYREPFLQMAMEAPPVAWKVFALLSSKQPFEGGVRISKKAVSEQLKISYDNVMRGFKWLKEHLYIKERKTDGQTEFLLNPNVTTCGRKRKEKIKLWEETA